MAPEAIDLMIEDAASFQIQVVYMKANEDGTTSVISEEECLAAVEAQQDAIATGGNDGWGNWTSSDGYMRMTISAVYIDPASMNGQKGWYYFHTWYEWLFRPKNRLTDAISIAAPECSWDTTNADNAFYSSRSCRTTANNYHNQSKTTEDLVVEKNGAYYSWIMPSDWVFEPYEYIQYYFRARARITYPDYSTVSVNVYSKYVHTYPWFSLGIDISFGWGNSSGIGVSLSPNVDVRDNSYYFNILHEYKP